MTCFFILLGFNESAQRSSPCREPQYIPMRDTPLCSPRSFKAPNAGLGSRTQQGVPLNIKPGSGQTSQSLVPHATLTALNQLQADTTQHLSGAGQGLPGLEGVLADPGLQQLPSERGAGGAWSLGKENRELWDHQVRYREGSRHPGSDHQDGLSLFRAASEATFSLHDFHKLI